MAQYIYQPKINDCEFSVEFDQYACEDTLSPLFLTGDASTILSQLPSEAVDCAMTSPPYWGKRQYIAGGIGREKSYQDYIDNLARVFMELKRILKPAGSFWLNIGDTYQSKKLVGIPWRVAFYLMDNQGWILRNHIVWNKVKSGMDTTKDRLGNIHESIFHFVKGPQYYYDVDSIRSKPRKAKVVNGTVVSATGVSGVRYRRQIELSTSLSETEKRNAITALESTLADVSRGKLDDFRMIIRGQQRTTHSNNQSVSGRAKELNDKGFYFLRNHPKGSKPSDVWDIIPEDTQNRPLHFAPYPVDLCRIPILATCPERGIILDPFSGTGTTLFAARMLNRKSVGIDISSAYHTIARERCDLLL